jgi:outer membrane protein assembly factor BamE (lipoprotein component of BamABCDE complex)
MNHRSLIFLLCVSLSLVNCVMVPIPTKEDKVLAGKPVTKEQLAFLRPKITMKQEVIERLGSPNVIWEDARVFVYNWEMRQGILFWVVGAYYTGGAGMTDIPKHYLLLIQFDEQDLVRRFERAACPFNKSYSEFLKEWVKNTAITSPRNPPDKME